MDGRSAPRRVRLFLRDFRMVDAAITFADGQSLAGYFANRRNYLNARDAKWTGTDEQVEHAVLRVDQVLWAAAPERDVPLVNASAQLRPRTIEVQLEGGLFMRAGLNLGDRQRLSDYLESAGQFIPMHDALLLRTGRPTKEVNVDLGDVVVNQSSIQGVWETALAPPPVADKDA